MASVARQKQPAGRKRNPDEIDIVNDPRGRRVIFEWQRWAGHVRQRHPEMAPYYGLALETVSQPDAIYRTKLDSPWEGEAYYKFFEPRATLMVVVRNGYMVTVRFAAARRSKSEVKIWP